TSASTNAALLSASETVLNSSTSADTNRLLDGRRARFEAVGVAVAARLAARWIANDDIEFLRLAVDDQSTASWEAVTSVMAARISGAEALAWLKDAVSIAEKPPNTPS